MANSENNNLSLQLSIITNLAIADGRRQNRAQLKIEKEGAPAKDVRVVLDLDGSAVFTSSMSGIYTLSTGEDGTITVDFVDTVAETVTLICFPVEEKQNIVSEVFEFLAESKVLKIDKVQTKNHSLYFGEPNIMWDGASFFINVIGGSGSLTWAIKEGEEQAIKLRSDDFGSAEVIAVSPFTGSRSITATDKVTGETVTHTFTVTDYLSLSTEKHTLSEVLEHDAQRLLSRSKFADLYEQWGKLSDYPGWLPDTLYWTNEYQIDTGMATYFNSTTGIFTQSSFIISGAEIEQGLALINDQVLS